MIKSTCPTDNFTCPRPSGSGICQTLLRKIHTKYGLHYMPAVQFCKISNIPSWDRASLALCAINSIQGSHILRTSRQGRSLDLVTALAPLSRVSLKQDIQTPKSHHVSSAELQDLFVGFLLNLTGTKITCTGYPIYTQVLPKSGKI